MNGTNMTLVISHGRRLFVALALMVGPLDPHAANGSGALCEEFRSLLGTRGGLTPYKLETPPDRDGNIRVPDLDIDKDGKHDEVAWSCPGSGSLIPADPCVLSIKLSGGKIIDFEESRFYLIRYRSNVYAVAADYALVDSRRPRAADIKTKIYRIDDAGVKLICSNL